MGATIDKGISTTEPPPQKEQQPKPLGAYMHFTVRQIFALDYVFV